MKAGGKGPGGKGTSGGKSGSQRKAGAGQAASGQAGNRMLTERVRTARGRTPSSTRWLQRQLNDPYVTEARRQGYRSRAAFKLIELDDRFHLLTQGKRVIDLGAAPGGWTQVAVQRVRADGQAGGRGGGQVVGIDILPYDPIPGAITMTHDFLAEDAPDLLKRAMGGPADLVLSDMAAPATGHPATDHLRIVAMAEVALDFALDVLAPGGAFVAKVFQGGSGKDLLERLKQHFTSVRHAKPPASRAESAETYVVATGFKGRPDMPAEAVSGED